MISIFSSLFFFSQVSFPFIPLGWTYKYIQNTHTHKWLCSLVFGSLIEFVENNKIVYKSSSKIGFSWPSFRCFSSFSRRFSFLFQFKQFRIMNSKLQKCVTFCLSWSFKIDSILFVTEWLLLCIVSFVPYFSSSFFFL